jgi:hypothetical protein
MSDIFNALEKILLNVMGEEKEKRSVERYETLNLIVDTCLIDDSDQPFETAVQHSNYNNGQWIVVGVYNTIEEALTGHHKWIEIMTTEPLPNKLVDIATDPITKTLRVLGDASLTFYRKRNTLNEL